MDELSLDNILDEAQIAELFPVEHIDELPEEEASDEETDETTEAEPIEEEEPESVGSGREIEEDTEPSTESNTSPNFYSSIANALVEDGIFQNLDSEEISKITSAEEFAEVFKKQQERDLNERQKRVEQALNYGVEPSAIQKHESLLNYLNNISDKQLENEEEAGENLRRSLIYQDYINRGFSQDRAKREVERSFKAGTDIDDAKEALQSNKEYYSESYKKLMDDAKAETNAVMAEQQKQAEELRAAIMDNEIVFGDIKVDKNTRAQIYNNVMKPTYKDPNTGDMLTALQKYSIEHRVDFLKNLGLIYTLTDGFTNLDKLVGSKVKKAMKKGLRDLENTINHTSRTSGGSLKYASGTSDPESKFIKWNINI